MLNNITPIILTYNEEPNLARTLSALDWAPEILVIDSYSNDATLNICESFANVKVIQNRFTTAADQCNFALGQTINTEWVLSMDADYIVTTDLREEISALVPNDDVKGFEVSFEYLINGSALKGSLYPPRTCLYRRSSANYYQDGHTQRVTIDGYVTPLKHRMQHDDRKPYKRWLASQKKYARLEADKLAHKNWRELSWPDRSRYWGIAPILVVPYTLFVKGLIINGWSGIEYTWQRFVAELVLQIARLNKFSRT